MSKIWSADDEEYLKQNYAFGNINELCKKFNVSKKAINKKAVRLNLKKWTEPQVDNLKTCIECKLRKEKNCFSKNKRKPDGLDSYCKECTNDRTKKHYELNKNHILDRHKNYNKLNKDKILISKKKYRDAVLIKDPHYRILHSLRQRVRDALKAKRTRKNNKTLELLGCSKYFLKNFLESKFVEGMNWDNYGNGDGKWVIDHIRPCSSFDLTDMEQQKLCFHYTNLQPLWWMDNLLKSDNYFLELQ
jgi:hypothetical protein